MGGCLRTGVTPLPGCSPWGSRRSRMAADQVTQVATETGLGVEAPAYWPQSWEGPRSCGHLWTVTVLHVY